MSSKYLVQVVVKITNRQKNITQKVLVFSLSEARRIKNIYLENYPNCIIEVKRKYREGWKIIQI